MHFVNSKLHKGQFIPGGYLRFLLITMRVENHWPKISYYVQYIDINIRHLRFFTIYFM